MKIYIIRPFLISIFIHISIYFVVQNKLINISTQPLNIKSVKINIKAHIKNKQNNHVLYGKINKGLKISKSLKTSKIVSSKDIFNNIKKKMVTNTENNNINNKENINNKNIETTNIETTNIETTNIETTNIETTNIETTNIETTNIETTNVIKSEFSDDNIKNDNNQINTMSLDVPKYLLSFNVYPRSYKVILNLTDNITLVSFEVINNEKLDFLDNELKRYFEKKLKKDINMQNKELEWLYQKQKNGEHETTQILQFLTKLLYLKENKKSPE